MIMPTYKTNIAYDIAYIMTVESGHLDSGQNYWGTHFTCVVTMRFQIKTDNTGYTKISPFLLFTIIGQGTAWATKRS
jgi:hypothetical protein